MLLQICHQCQKPFTVLDDRTLPDHARPDTPFLLCPGSRTAAAGEDGASDLPHPPAVHKPRWHGSTQLQVN